MLCQKDQFNIPADVSYLNCSYMSPQMKRVERVGIEAILKQGTPYSYSTNDFFEPSTQLKKAFSDLVEAEDPGRVAIIPSTSYGLANVAKNLDLKRGEQIVVVEEQFPSNIYPWITEAQQVGAIIEVIKAPSASDHKGQEWNERILSAITDQTKLVALGHIHWMDGMLFDLAAIRKKTWDHDALLVVDGTQSVGALPFSVKNFQPDALISVSYTHLTLPTILLV